MENKKGKGLKIVTMQCSECGHEVPAGKDRCLYCGAQQEGVVKADEGAEADVKPEDAASASMDDVPWQFALEKTKRRKPLGIATQIIIFFAAFALMGVIVLLLS
ncbi:MAG: hypothetical protein PVI53_00780 [Desulfobacteraceae bacterium]